MCAGPWNIDHHSATYERVLDSVPQVQAGWDQNLESNRLLESDTACEGYERSSKPVLHSQPALEYGYYSVLQRTLEFESSALQLCFGGQFIPRAAVFPFQTNRRWISPSGLFHLTRR